VFNLKPLGHGTYLAAAGLFALGVFDITSGNVPGGIQSILGGLAAIGIHVSLPTAPTVPATTKA
jgi:hypothetical protein